MKGVRIPCCMIRIESGGDDLCQRVHTELNRLAGGPESPSLVPEGGGDFYRWSLALCLLTLFVSGP